VSNSSVILGIESAIGGGSISVYRMDSEIEGWVGEEGVSRAEELLPNIDRMLASNGFTKGDLRSIVVSTGPGSYTGIRLGLATALGLKVALGIPCFGLTSLEAISLLGPANRPVVALLPMGRDLLCVQSFDFQRAVSDPQVTTLKDLLNSIMPTSRTIIAHSDVYSRVAALAVSGGQLVNAGTNIATHLCSAIASEFATDDLSPLFVERNSV